MPCMQIVKEMTSDYNYSRSLPTLPNMETFTKLILFTYEARCLSACNFLHLLLTYYLILHINSKTTAMANDSLVVTKDCIL